MKVESGTVDPLVVTPMVVLEYKNSFVLSTVSNARVSELKYFSQCRSSVR